MTRVTRSSVDSDLCAYPELPELWDSVILPVDKPTGISSYDVIRQLKRLLPDKKLGHAGTLDPLATGLLICLIGRATKTMRFILEEEKTYEGVMRLGETTASYDSETPVLEKRDTSHITAEDIENGRLEFLGTLIQSTPMYSAVRMGGERLYKKARRGERLKTPMRVVTVSSFNLEEPGGNDISFVLRCSSGTYVRSIVHEFGQKLGVGAHLTSLRRTRIGAVTIDQAWRLETLTEQIAGSPGPSGQRNA